MKRFVFVVGAMALSLCARAVEPSLEPALAAIRDLGRINGQALACGQKETATWTRILMQNHAPKTRSFGEAFEEGTQETFLALGKDPAACPDAVALAGRLEEVTERLRKTLPSAHSFEQASAADIIPRYLLQDPRGHAITNEDFSGRFQLISFGYTSCPDVCPTTLLEMKEILKALGAKAERLQPIFITVDPERDTAQVLREYTTAFDARILGLTGSPELVRRAADNFKVRYEKVREPGAPPERYTVDHSAGLFLLGPDGMFVSKFAYGTPAKDVAERIAAFIDDALARMPAPRDKR